MNGAYLQCKLLEKKALIEMIKCRIAGMEVANKYQWSIAKEPVYSSDKFFHCEETLLSLANEVRDLGDQYAKTKGWAE